MAKEDLKYISNAGAVFLGNYSPEPIGDYFAGPNHTLPTRSIKRISVSKMVLIGKAESGNGAPLATVNLVLQFCATSVDPVEVHLVVAV